MRECRELKEVNQLVASDSKEGSYFGSSVALSANGLVAIIGADGDNTKAVNAGKVYTYKRNSIDSDWEEISQLTASDAKKGDGFGASVSLSSDGLVAMIGASYKNTKTISDGKVYTYKRSSIDEDWQEVNQLEASTHEEFNYFGSSVALSANGLIAIIGAEGDDTQAVSAGKVYTYKRDSIDADWEEVNQLETSTHEEFNYFGSSVALSADGLIAIVGAFGENTKTVSAGKVYTYKRDSIDADWIEVSQLTASDIDEYDYFGSSVALSADGLISIVGASGKNNNIYNAGKVYVYKRNNISDNWKEVLQLTASDSKRYDSFGTSVAMSADDKVIMIGADDDNYESNGAGKVYTYIVQ